MSLIKKGNILKNIKSENDKNTILYISLRAISKNYNLCKSKLGPTVECAAVVKANAYGLGISEVTKHLIKNKCKSFFVAHLSEALKLRRLNNKIKIFLLHGVSNETIKTIYKNKIIPVVNSLAQLKIVRNYGRKNKIKFKIALHFDTGISRLGLDDKETNILMNNNLLLDQVTVSLIMSHLACGDDKKNRMNKLQLNKFLEIKRRFPKAKASLSNTAGIFLGKSYHFDLVRPGISLYGGSPFLNNNLKLNNVICLLARVIQIRNINKGDKVGYGATYKAKKNMKIGTISVGYADGFFRHFNNNFNFYFEKKRLNVVGRISMDLITLDLSNIKDTKLKKDMYVEIINDRNNVDYISKKYNTIPNEILTSLGNRFHRKYFI